MNFRSFNHQKNNFMNNDNHNNSFSGSEPEENSKDDTHTIDNELHLGKNASIPEVQHPRFQKPIVTSTTQRKKSILKPSRTFDRSSSDEQITKNNYFLEKGNAHTPHEPPSEISEIEKAASFLNNKTAEEYIVKEENSQAENTPQNNRPQTKIPNFGVLSKFSPNREPHHNQFLDISSPLSQGEQDRNETEESHKEHIVGKIEKIEGKLLPPSLPLEAHNNIDINKDKSNSNRLFSQTPLFKTEKTQKTTDSGSNNPATGSGSITIIQNEEPINQPSVKEDNRSKMSNSEAMDSHQRRLNDSALSKRHAKKATFFANEAKNGNIIPGYTRYVLDENINQQQVYMPHFSDREIFESFKTLDINKAGYITGIEIKHFLEVLEEEVNEAEIEEMVRMLDYEGTQRVRYEEFYKMATGKNLNPIGQAYPPTLDLFEKKKNADINHERKIRAEQTSTYEKTTYENSNRNPPTMMARESGRHSNMNPTSRAELELNYPKHTAKIDNKLSKLPRLGDLGDEGVKPIKTDKDETDTYFKGFIRQAGLSVKTYMEKYDIVQFSNHHKVAKATYKDFLGFFVIDDQDVTKKIFSLVGRDRNYVDLRQMMIAISMYLEFNTDEKISLAYELYDPENHGYILYMELMKVFNMFQIGEENKKLERKIKTILNRRSVMPEDSISKEEFVVICKNFPDLFH